MRDIAATVAIVGEAFKKEITEGKTDAKPEIWKEWEKFCRCRSVRKGKATRSLRSPNLVPWKPLRRR